MRMRVGKVTQVYPDTGKVQVLYEDEGNASLQLSMITMNQEYFMPAVGDRVLTMHMENGSSKGFVLGTYYGGGTQPKANTGYRKDFDGGAYAVCRNGAYRLSAGSIALLGGGAEDADSEPDVYLKIDSESEIKAPTLLIDADDLTLKCSYGQETFENILKRIERIEDMLGLPHTI